MTFHVVLTATAIIAGAIASITGFGIGSLITPVLSLAIDTKLAVAVVSIPHLIATAIRFWMLRRHVDRKLLFNFGILSAIGGLTGALLHEWLGSPALTLIFGIILLFAGFMGVSGLSQKFRFRGGGAAVAGAISGMLGGLVGNQGGIRSAALLGFEIPKESFVATATAVGLVVDASRIPVYLWKDGDGIVANGNVLLLTTIGVVAGTYLGTHLLKRLPEQTFRGVVSGLIFMLGAWMTYRGLNS